METVHTSSSIGCNVVTHHIVTSEEVVPKQVHRHPVAETLKSDVYRQINELLEMGLIQPSLSPMTSPIVCVTNNDGGIGIAVYYRYLNSLLSAMRFLCQLSVSHC